MLLLVSIICHNERANRVCSFGIFPFLCTFCSAIHDTKATKRIPMLRIKTTSSFTITAVVSDRFYCLCVCVFFPHFFYTFYIFFSSIIFFYESTPLALVLINISLSVVSVVVWWSYIQPLLCDGSDACREKKTNIFLVCRRNQIANS